MGCYAKAVVRFPYVFIILVIVFASVTGPITIWLYGIPDFSDPSKGFDPRGTEITGWTLTAQFINEKLQDGNLTVIPGTSTPDQSIGSFDPAVSIGNPNPALDRVSTDPRQMPRFVVSAVFPEDNLLSPRLLRAICDLQEDVILSKCAGLCDIMSLPFLIGQYQNKNCDEINSSDISSIIALIQDHIELHFNGTLLIGCDGITTIFNDSFMESNCTKRMLVHRILNEFVDEGFMSNGAIQNTHVTYSTIFMNWKANKSDLQDFYIEHLHQQYLSNDLVKMSGMELLILSDMSQWFINQDLVWYGLALALVILILVLYLRSISLMITVILNVVFSLSLAYWFYFVVCRFKFFPFINILAALVLIALGADDLFIFYDIWRQELQNNPSITYENLVSLVLQHGGVSVFVTSVTTAAALLANLVSEITSIRCFGAFASICVLMNIVLFITWVPAMLVITEKINWKCKHEICTSCSDSGKKICCKTIKCKSKNTHIWDKFMPTIINKGAIFWIILITLASVGAFLVVFWNPKLKLPSTNNFPFLVPSHPFEIYTRELKDEFRFEEPVSGSVDISCQYIWGAEGKDNGDLLDANNLGHLAFHQDFNLYNSEAQIWMQQFCRGLLLESFIHPAFNDTAVCYFDLFELFINRECNSTLNMTNTCCGLSFPSTVSNTQECMLQFAIDQEKYLNNTNKTQIIGRPLFDLTNQVRIFQLYFDTMFKLNANYENMKSTYEALSEFSSDRLSNAPPSLGNSWFTGEQLYEFRFFSIQKSLSEGTLSGIGISLAVSSVVLLITTLNVILTIQAMITIAFVLITTTAALTLMGWELNFEEALSLTLSMGLSIDFTIHHGVAYNLSKASTRAARVQEALATVGSAVSMAALTTLSAGAAMMLGQVWAFRQFGTFLVLTMVFSWFYANFFFLSKCSLFGPIGNLGNLKALCCRTTQKSKESSAKIQTSNGCVSNGHANKIISNGSAVTNGITNHVSNGGFVPAAKQSELPLNMLDIPLGSIRSDSILLESARKKSVKRKTINSILNTNLPPDKSFETIPNRKTNHLVYSNGFIKSNTLDDLTVFKDDIDFYEVFNY